jgi:hypothetical protein
MHMHFGTTVLPVEVLLLRLACLPACRRCCAGGLVLKLQKMLWREAARLTQESACGSGWGSCALAVAVLARQQVCLDCITAF